MAKTFCEMRFIADYCLQNFLVMLKDSIVDYEALYGIDSSVEQRMHLWNGEVVF